VAGAFLDAERGVGDDADGQDALAGECAAEGPGDAAAVAEDADVEVVADAAGLGAFEGEVCSRRLMPSATPAALGLSGCPPNASSIELD
jgi:hypothetical protein